MHPQWHIDRHPLHTKCCDDVFADECEIERNIMSPSNNDSNLSSSFIDINTFHQIKYPKKSSSPYNFLFGLSQRIIEAVKGNQLLYKKAVVKYTSILENCVSEITSGIQQVALPSKSNKKETSSVT